ncbi:MAG: S8 family serine peptidase [Rhodospirillales bacterium]
MRNLVVVLAVLALVGLAGGALLVIEHESERAAVAGTAIHARTGGEPDALGRRAAAAADEDWRTLAGRPAPADLGRRRDVPRLGAEGRGPETLRGGAGAPPADRGAGRAADRAFEPGEVLAANPPAGFEPGAAALGFRIVEISDLGHLDLRVYRLRTPPLLDVAAALRSLRGRFPGLLADANHHYAVSAGAQRPESYARTLIGWRNAPSDCGGGIHLGMIDTGIELQHPALSGADLAYRRFHNPARSPGTPDHGTAIAAMFVGRADGGQGWGGLLPGARLSAANIFEITDGGSMMGSAGGFLRAVDWLAERRVHVVNMSIAGPDNQIVRAAIERARARGLILVAAAGNNGDDAEPAYPAAYPDVIAVTAIDAEQRIYRYANRGSYIDFAAPGVHVWTASPGGGRYQSGTSFASPYVSVLAALAVAAGERPKPDLIRARLRRNAVDLGPPGRDPTFGWGLVGTEADCPERPGRR